MNTKVCITCKCEKPLTEFALAKKNLDGRRGQCKICKSTRAKELAKTKPCKPYKRKTPRDYKSRMIRNCAYRYKYNITIDDFERMSVEQDHKCAICGMSGSDTKTGLVVDHCHETGKVRGLLCRLCNNGLGRFGDNVAGLTKVLAYVSKT